MPPAANLAGWRLGLAAIEHPFANQLHETGDPYAVVRGLGLAVPAYVVSSPAEFLQDPKAALQPLDSRGITNFYVGLRSPDPHAA